jgi:hypothetical protein
MNSGADTLAGGFPHSEILGSKLVCQLPGAYRRLPRPSSPVIAKASTVCAYSLDHITPRSLRSHMFAGPNADATYPDCTRALITRTRMQSIETSEVIACLAPY